MYGWKVISSEGHRTCKQTIQWTFHAQLGFLAPNILNYRDKKHHPKQKQQIRFKFETKTIIANSILV